MLMCVISLNYLNPKSIICEWKSQQPNILVDVIDVGKLTFHIFLTNAMFGHLFLTFNYGETFIQKSNFLAKENIKRFLQGDSEEEVGGEESNDEEMVIMTSDHDSSELEISDEEEDPLAESDVQNHSDIFVGKDKKAKWHKSSNICNFSRKGDEEFEPGPTITLIESELEAFQMCFTDAIVGETIRYTNKYISTIQSNFARESDTAYKCSNTEMLKSTIVKYKTIHRFNTERISRRSHAAIFGNFDSDSVNHRRTGPPPNIAVVSWRNYCEENTKTITFLAYLFVGVTFFLENNKYHSEQVRLYGVIVRKKLEKISFSIDYNIHSLLTRPDGNFFDSKKNIFQTFQGIFTHTNKNEAGNNTIVQLSKIQFSYEWFTGLVLVTPQDFNYLLTLLLQVARIPPRIIIESIFEYIRTEWQQFHVWFELIQDE
ncbi:hypothetical protein Bhyg_03009 [Pseudolycoriella hygida]|uniref:Uncharacterized protein n=1 Tax=Pseudolycoriella hygida TaxID=35572 RepID=A0A9Q0NCI2_9DIPT|nr:hypothetical protein Bhyg_03009 [Pseudolycoriella hygida]